MRFELRPKLVAVHRWAGLTIALFLVLAGLTGSIMVWNDDLEAFVRPDLFISRPAPGQQAIDPLILRERVLKVYPDAQIPYAPLRHDVGGTLMFRLTPRDDLKKALEVDQVFVDPYRGEIVGQRKWGDISEGSKNLLPFIYRLHKSLALEKVGSYLLGIVALIWTLDCFIGAWLTLPPRRKPTERRTFQDWCKRWGTAWKVKRKATPLRRNYDLHRAGGLWPWAMLFVLAWSSVAFNLPEVYEPVMRTLLASPREAMAAAPATPPNDSSPMPWNEAREKGRQLMQEFARDAGFDIVWEGALVHFPKHRAYRYDVHSSLDVRASGSKTRVLFDDTSGELRLRAKASGDNAADTTRMWITAIHLADLWGLPFRILIFLMGGVVVMLSVTGIYLWWKKRYSRTKARHQVVQAGQGVR